MVNFIILGIFVRLRVLKNGELDYSRVVIVVGFDLINVSSFDNLVLNL